MGVTLQFVLMGWLVQDQCNDDHTYGSYDVLMSWTSSNNYGFRLPGEIAKTVAHIVYAENQGFYKLKPSVNSLLSLAIMSKGFSLSWQTSRMASVFRISEICTYFPLSLKLSLMVFFKKNHGDHLVYLVALVIPWRGCWIQFKLSDWIWDEDNIILTMKPPEACR